MQRTPFAPFCAGLRCRRRVLGQTHAAGRAAGHAGPTLAQLPDVDMTAVLAHTKMLSSDEFEGRAPGTEGRRADGRLPGRAVQEGRASSPATPTARTSRRCRSSASRRRPRRSSSRKARTTAARSSGKTMSSRGPSTSPTPRASRTPSSCSSATASWRPSTTGTTTRASTSRARRSSCSSTIRRCPIPPNAGELDPKTFGGKAMTYYGRWTYKYEIGAEKGAAGVLIVHETGAGRLSVRRRAGQGRRAVRPGDARQEHGPRGDRRLDHARSGDRRCSRWPGRTSTR